MRVDAFLRMWTDAFSRLWAGFQGVSSTGVFECTAHHDHWTEIYPLYVWRVCTLNKGAPSAYMFPFRVKGNQRRWLNPTFLKELAVGRIPVLKDAVESRSSGKTGG